MWTWTEKQKQFIKLITAGKIPTLDMNMIDWVPFCPTSWLAAFFSVSTYSFILRIKPELSLCYLPGWKSPTQSSSTIQLMSKQPASVANSNRETVLALEWQTTRRINELASPVAQNKISRMLPDSCLIGYQGVKDAHSCGREMSSALFLNTWTFGKWKCKSSSCFQSGKLYANSEHICPTCLLSLHMIDMQILFYDMPRVKLRAMQMLTLLHLQISLG